MLVRAQALLLFFIDFMKTYTELSKLPTFIQRFDYLKLNSKIGEDTFGFDRYLNQVFYRSKEWRKVRNFVIVRDNGNDLGLEGYPIGGKILIHHMNPINVHDILQRNEAILDPEYLVCVSNDTHQAIHYGSEDLLPQDPVERKPNDTCPWKSGEKVSVI